MLRFLPVLMAAVVVAGLIPGPDARAAEANSLRGIEEVVVTARRREENIQSVPIPVTALSDEDLRGRGAEDLTDLTRLTPNLAFNHSASNKGAAEVFLRGIGQVNWSPTQDPKVGVYLDGVYLGRPQGAVFDMLDIDRIEVLRGPQGTLFGRNTTAGLVHVITRKPQSHFESWVYAGAGNDAQKSLGGMLNVPLTDDLAVRFSAQHRQSDGYVKNRSTGDDWNDENSQLGRASLLWTPSEKLDVQLSVDYQRVREHPNLGSCEWTGPADGSATLATGGLPFIAYVFGVYDDIANACNDTRPYHSDENDPDQSDLDQWGSNLTAHWDLGFGELTSITAYRDTKDLNGSWGWASDKVGTPSYLEVIGRRDSDSDQWSQELRLAGTAAGGRLDWVGGVYGFRENAVNYLDVPVFRGVAAPDCAAWPIFCFPLDPSNPAAGTLGDIALATQLFGSRRQTVDATNSSFAVFGEITYRFTERWSLTAGARYTNDDRDFTRSQTLTIGIPDPTLTCPGGGAPLNGTTCKRQQSFDKVTPRLIFSYQASDDVMLYAGWSRGYSSGGFNQDVRMRPFEPETSDNWEGGIKSTWLDQRLLINLTGFFNTYKNQQITVGRLVGGQPTADLINAQKAELYGIEAELQVVPAPGWMIRGSFGWIDGEYKEFTVLDNSIGPPPDFQEIIVERDLSDTEVVRGAPYTASVSASYTHYFSGGGDLSGQVGYARRGRTYNTLETLNSSRQDAYGLVDARLTWSLPNGATSISLWGTNLTDEEYFPTAIDLSAPPAPSDTVTKYWAEPRRFGLEIRYAFSK